MNMLSVPSTLKFSPDSIIGIQFLILSLLRKVFAQNFISETGISPPLEGAGGRKNAKIRDKNLEFPPPAPLQRGKWFSSPNEILSKQEIIQIIRLFRLDSIFKRPFQKPISTILILIFSYIGLIAQSGCPDCIISLPDSLQEDTFYLQEFPEGQYLNAYDENITYRLPTNTSQVLYLVPSLPSGIGINELSVKAINNLPAGLSWEPNQKNYNLPDERDGCIRVCGTPLEYGMFTLEITVTAQVSILNQDATFTRNIYIAPPTTSNNGFTMTNNIGCGSTAVSFVNNNPSNSSTGYSYTWNFGLSSSTNDENPIVQNYTEPGIYPIHYQAIIDTVGYILTEIKIVEAGCDDFLGKPDLKLRIYDSNDSIIFQNESIDNMEPPVSFPLNLPIFSGNYKFEVIDDDSGLGGGDDNCGTINFNRLTNGNLEDGDLKVSINIFHPVDTIKVVDSVIVNTIPSPPIVSYDGLFIFCQGDSLVLSASGLADNQQWYRDSTPIAAATATTLKIAEGGGYYIASISEAGCINTSPIAFLNPIPLPEAPVIKQEGNLLSIFNPAILPDPYGLRWFQEGNYLDHTNFALCISETAKYGVELMDNTSGCSNYFESVYSFDENGICSTAATDLSTTIDNIKIYPNPVQANLRVDLQLNQSLPNGRISLVNLLGQTLAIQQVGSTNQEQHIEFYMADYLPGFYFLRLEGTGKVSSWKVLKQ